MNRSRILLPTLLLFPLLFAALLAPSLAPYSPRQQFRDFSRTGPSRISGRLGEYGWPSLFVDNRPDGQGSLRPVRLTFWVEGFRYGFAGMNCNRHLFGTVEEGQPVFLFGTDSLGRDLFSRTLYGMRFSVSLGLIGILFTAGAGWVLGALSGYAGGWADRLIMRTCDLLLSLPGLFLVLGIGAIFPLKLTGVSSFWMIVLIFSLMGSASITRVVRGQVLSLKEREYVLASRSFGASHWWILRRHILPFTGNFLLVQCSMFVPLFILGEITLSFLGVGVQEPDVSLGTLLQNAKSIQVLTLYRWELWPVVLIFLLIFGLNWLSEQLKGSHTVRPNWW